MKHQFKITECNDSDEVDILLLKNQIRFTLHLL